MHPTSNNIGAYIKAVIGVGPGDRAAGTVNGSAIDRTGYNSCTLFGMVGAASGAPSAQSSIDKLQESDDGSTGWTDISGAAITALDADNASGKVDVDLTGAKKFIRAVNTVAFTAGTSPAIESASVVVLGGAEELPAA